MEIIHTWKDVLYIETGPLLPDTLLLQSRIYLVYFRVSSLIPVL